MKIIESRYIVIFPIIDKINDIGRRLPQIMGDLKQLSAILSIAKMTRKLSEIYCYKKSYLLYIHECKFMGEHLYVYAYKLGASLGKKHQTGTDGQTMRF